MIFVVSWLVVVSLIGLWSLTVWVTQAIAVWTVTNAGAFSGAASSISAAVLPSWLAPWVPEEVEKVLPELIATLGPLVDSLLQAAPALAGGLTMLAWLVWGVGGVMLLLLGVGLHLMLAVWRRRIHSGSGSNTGTSLAAG